jgi:murein DD-endopeptidase / murein LD-carboxypeptidase
VTGKEVELSRKDEAECCSSAGALRAVSIWQARGLLEGGRRTPENFVTERPGRKLYFRVTHMLDCRLDLSQSPIKIPERFHQVRYNHDRYPGVRGLVGDANCQQYAYEFLREFGYTIPHFRSSDLWEDTEHTVVSKLPEAFDLIFVNDKPDSWGAHIGVCLGNEAVLHLSQKIGMPAIERIASLTERRQYRYLIGFKRVLFRF